MYKKTKNENEIIRLSDGTVITEGSRGWQKYQKWIDDGNMAQPYELPTPPTNSEIYDQAIKNSKVLKALVLALNDGTIVPGANVSSAELKTAIKSKM